jgi:hypothetical protein
MKKIEFPELEPYIEKLGLKWQVTYILAPKETTCRVSSYPEIKKHKIWVHSEVISHRLLFLPDLVHELCHCKLAEEIDPIFSTFSFPKRYQKLEGQKAKNFKIASEMLYLAFSLVDIWVNDLRHSLWPELTLKDYESYSRALLFFAKEEFWPAIGRFIETPENILGIALYLADNKRRSFLPVDLTLLFKHLSKENKMFIQRLANFYSSLPYLSYKRESDLKTLEKSVKKVVKLLGFPISPKLIEEKGRIVWQIPEIEK